jgi:hypothetical protein
LKIKPENRFWIAIYGFAAFILLVAVGVFGWLAWTSKEEPGVGHVAGPVPASLATISLPDEEYSLLAEFKAPGYVPQRRAPPAFPSAMKLYEKENYAAAASALRAVAAAQPDFVPARFYLGISRLLAGDRIAGIEELRAITESGASPYLDRARFYLAKGLIAEHDLKRAEQQLQSLIDEHGGLAAQAAALLARIRQS